MHTVSTNICERMGCSQFQCGTVIGCHLCSKSSCEISWLLNIPQLPIYLFFFLKSFYQILWNVSVYTCRYIKSHHSTPTLFLYLKFLIRLKQWLANRRGSLRSEISYQDISRRPWLLPPVAKLSSVNSWWLDENVLVCLLVGLVVNHWISLQFSWLFFYYHQEPGMLEFLSKMSLLYRLP